MNELNSFLLVIPLKIPHVPKINKRTGFSSRRQQKTIPNKLSTSLHGY